jgi:hypothetical protein
MRGEVDGGVVGLAVPQSMHELGIIGRLYVACFGGPDVMSVITVRALLTATAETRHP